MRLTPLPLALMLNSVLLFGTLSARSTTEVDGKTYPVYALDDEVKPLSVANPVYPLAALKERRGGRIQVVTLIDEKGKVSRAQVAKSEAANDLQQAAVKSVYDWRFPVIKEDGKAIRYAVFVWVAFETGAPSSAQPTGTPTSKLEEVIFDSKYLKQILHPKTIISPIAPDTEIRPELTEAIKQAGLGDVTQLIALPAGATPPKRDKMISPKYPDDQRRKGTTGQASFLVYVGANGKVLGLYCYHASDRVFATASAVAILQWTFKPAKFGDTAIPVLTVQPMIFDID